MTTDPRTGITLLSTQQRYKEQLINEGFAHLGAIATGAVVNLSLNSPPPNPSLGEVYFVPSGATGVWTGHENKLALKIEGGWTYFNIPLNHRIYALLPEGLYRWDGTDWIAIVSEGDMLKSVYDTTNNGIVDDSEALEGQAGSYYRDRINHIGTQPLSSLSQSGATNGQVVQWNGSAWVPVTPSNGTPIAASDEGVQLTSNVTSFNFVGAGVTSTGSGGAVTVNIPNSSVIYSAFESVTANKTLANADHEKTLLVSGAVTITLPVVTQNIRVNVRLVSGSVTFTGSGTTRSPSTGNLSTINSNVYCEFNSSNNTWYLSGALA